MIMKARYSVDTVSSYIIKYSDEHFGGVSNLRLQKLLYFVQVEFIKTFNEAAFKEEIVAWSFGPVVPEIYRKYKVFGRENILINRDSDARLPFWVDTLDSQIGEDDAKVIDKVLNEASDISTAELVRISHVQDPWRNAYYRSENKDKLITKKAIYNYFVG